MKAVMNEAELYTQSNSLQRRDALDCLKEYGFKVKWKFSEDRVLDVGCGDGSVTTDILRIFLPDNFKRLTGCDISERMVNFAKTHHKDERTHFTVLDIEGDLPKKMRESYDHVFSFYTLHWIRNQEKAFKNIYDLLSEGGDCLLLFLGHMPVFDVYRILSKKPKWSPWVKDVENYISPYHDSQVPELEVRRIMERVGFKNIEVNCKERVIIYDKLEHIKKSVMAISPFNIPKDLHEEFMDDYLGVVRDLRLMDEANNNIISVKANYNLIVAYGRKL